MNKDEVFKAIKTYLDDMPEMNLDIKSWTSGKDDKIHIEIYQK